MNHLAHLFLAGDSAESLLGNLAGDFVKGRLGDRFTPAIRQGIMEHRMIDAFTDTHPAVAAFRRVIAFEHGHYARVISDVFFDHFLASDWNEYAAETLPVFLERVFSALDPHISEMPGNLRFVYPRMRDGRWLLSYREIDGIRIALTNMSQRFSRQPHLEMSVHLLTDARATLEEHFRRFFPDVVEYAAKLR